MPEKKPASPDQTEGITAVGEHVLVQRPEKIAAIGGILLPEKVQQRTFYGRAFSVGPLCKQVKTGDIVVYRKAGTENVVFDELCRDAEGDGFTAIIEEMILATLTEKAAQRLGLRLPD